MLKRLLWMLVLTCMFKPILAKMPDLTNDGFILRSDNGENALLIGLLFQGDQDIFFNTQGVTINNGVNSIPIYNRDTVDRIWVRRIRPSLTGYVLEHHFFVLGVDFGQGQTRLFDSLADIQYVKWLGFSAGKQLSFLAGLEQLKDLGTLYTMEMGYPSGMAPNREIGFAIHGELGKDVLIKNPYVDQRGFQSLFAYQLGIFSGTADNTNPGLNPTSTTAFSTETASLADKAIEGRIFSNPFMNHHPWLRGLGVGFAAGFDNPNNQAELPAILSVGQNPIFVYMSSVAANGQRYRFHPQGYWFSGPLGVTMDWAFTTQHVSNYTVDVHDTPLMNIMQHNHAGQAQLIYNLTGEPHASYMERLTPRVNFNPKQRGAWGAFQLIGRWSNLRMDPSIFTQNSIVGDDLIYTFADPRISVSAANTWSVGLNWILNRYTRVLIEYDYTTFQGGCSTGAMSANLNPGCLVSGEAAYALTSTVENRPPEQMFMQRVQIQF